MILAALVVGVGLLVAACGGGDDDAASAPAEPAPAPQPAPPPAPEPAPEPPAEPAPPAGGDVAAGRAIFASAGCGVCHTLSDAGTDGTIGPDLDQARPELEEAVEIITAGAPPMPAYGSDGTLTDAEVLDVATYVVEVSSG